MKTWMGIILLLGTLISCREGKTGFLHIQAGKNPEKSMDVSSFADTIEYIRLQPEEGALVGMVHNLQFAGDLILVLDAEPEARMLAFDRKGKLKYLIDDLGKGPDEYADIENFTVHEKEGLLVLYERTRRKLHFYDLSTGVRRGSRDCHLYFTFFSALPDGGYLLLAEEDAAYRYLVVDSLFHPVGGVENWNMNLDMEFPAVFTRYGEETWFSNLKTSEIYAVTNDGKRLEKRASVDFGAHSVPEVLFDSKEDKRDFMLEEVLEKNLALGIHGIFPGKQRWILSYFQGEGDRIAPRFCVISKTGETRVAEKLYDNFHKVTLSGLPWVRTGNYIGGFISPEEFENCGIKNIYPDLTENDNYILYLIRLQEDS